MGLDMYLYAERAYDPESDDARRILDTAEITLHDLQRLAGLDPMREETEVYLSRWGWDPEADRLRSEAVEEAAGLLAFNTEHSAGGALRWADGKVVVSISCGYWRKANAVHAWFVDNCQDGVDECQSSKVEGEQLAHLRSLCADALNAYAAGDLAKAREIMEPRPGFFFGSYDIDDGWAVDMADTLEIVERVIPLAIEAARTGPPVTFVYHSSW